MDPGPAPSINENDLRRDTGVAPVLVIGVLFEAALNRPTSYSGRDSIGAGAATAVVQRWFRIKFTRAARRCRRSRRSPARGGLFRGVGVVDLHGVVVDDLRSRLFRLAGPVSGNLTLARRAGPVAPMPGRPSELPSDRGVTPPMEIGSVADILRREARPAIVPTLYAPDASARVYWVASSLASQLSRRTPVKVPSALYSIRYSSNPRLTLPSSDQVVGTRILECEQFHLDAQAAAHGGAFPFPALRPGSGR